MFRDEALAKEQADIHTWGAPLLYFMHELGHHSIRVALSSSGRSMRVSRHGLNDMGCARADIIPFLTPSINKYRCSHSHHHNPSLIVFPSVEPHQKALLHHQL